MPGLASRRPHRRLIWCPTGRFVNYVVCYYQYPHRNTSISRNNGETHQELSKTQAHEVVVPWQHQAVSEEQASTGMREEPVDVDGGGNTGMVSYESVLDWMLQWHGRGRCKPKLIYFTCFGTTVARYRASVQRAVLVLRRTLLSDGTGGVECIVEHGTKRRMLRC